MAYGTGGAVRIARQPVFLSSRPRDRERTIVRSLVGEQITPVRHRRARVSIALPLDGPKLTGDARVRATYALWDRIEQWIDNMDVRGEIALIEARPSDGVVILQCSSLVKRRLRRALAADAVVSAASI